MTQVPQASSGPSYPTSSKHGVKDWDKLATDLTKKKKEKSKDEKAKDKDGADQGDDSGADSDYGGGDDVVVRTSSVTITAAAAAAAAVFEYSSAVAVFNFGGTCLPLFFL